MVHSFVFDAAPLALGSKRLFSLFSVGVALFSWFAVGFDSPLGLQERG